MSGLLPPVVGRLVGENADYLRSLNEAESATKGSTQRSAGHFSKLGGAIGTAMKVGAAAGGVAVAGFFAKAVMGASDLAETMSKVGVVFGDQAGQVTSFANQMAKDFGLPKGAILDAASSIGLIGKASGMSQGDAAKMSTQLGKLAADASSFYNVPLPEALQAIQSGLVGEAEPMRRFGVLLNEQAVETEAARLGLQKVNGEYTEGAKAQARASLIMSGMKDASGDLERTQGSLSNRMRELQGRAENFAASVGTAVVPMLLKFLDFGEKVGSVVGPALKGVFDIFAKGDFTGGFSKLGIEEDSPVIDAMFKIRDAIIGAVDDIVGWVKKNWPEIKRIITETLKTAQAIIKGVVDVITTIWENFGDQIKDVIRAAWEYVKSTIDAALKVIQGIVKIVTGIIHGDWSQVWEGIKQVLAGAWDFIMARVQFAIDVVKAILSAALEIIGSIWRGAWEGIKSFFGGIWDSIFAFAREGVARIVDAFLGMAGLIIHAADSAFGWIPGIGDKLHDARVAFDDFRDDVNRALRGIQDKTVNINVVTNYYDPGGPYGGRELGPGRTGIQFAEGGFVDRATMALIGEAGRELVLPLTDMNRTSQLLRQAGLLKPFSSVSGGSAIGGGVGGGGVTNVVNIYTATGDIPDETIRKIRTQLGELAMDMPGGQVIPT